MPLRVTNLTRAGDMAVLNRWAEDIEASIKKNQVQTARATVKASNPVSTGGLSSVGLEMPPEFVVTNSPLTSNGDLIVTKAVEGQNTVYAGPTAISSFEGYGGTSGGTTAVSVSATPIDTATFGLYFQFSNNNTTGAPAGWTVMHTDSSSNSYYKNITGTDPVTVSQTLSAATNWVANLLLFKGTVPSVAQVKSAQTFAQSTATAFSSNNTAGNTIVIVLQAYNTGGAFTLKLTDTNGNVYENLTNNAVGNGGGHPGVQQSVFVCNNCVGGANTVNWSGAGTASPPFLLEIVMVEFGAFGTGNGLPFFRLLTEADIPLLPISKLLGVLPVGNGGTGSDLSATGATHRFLKQASAGAAITVTEVDVGDLAGAGKLTFYNGQTLVDNGVPSEFAHINNTAQAADVSISNIFSPLFITGLFRISFYQYVTQAASSTSTLPDLLIQWVDGNSGVTQSQTFVSGSPSANTTTTGFSGSQIIWAQTGSAVKYQTGATTAYASSGVTPMQYSTHIKIEAL